MSILLPLQPTPEVQEPLWVPAPERPTLPIHELHIWKARLSETRAGEEAGGYDDCPVSRDRSEKLKVMLFRNDILDRYLSMPGAIKGPAAGLRVALAQCDHLALIAVSRDVRAVGLDVERVREDIPIEEMAGGFLDARAQWDLRVTWSQQEKAWKFFQFWTSNEACAQARPLTRSAASCEVRGFSPEAEYIAALAVEGGPAAGLMYWDWNVR